MNKIYSVKEFDYLYKDKTNNSFFEALVEFASHEENYNILKIARGGDAVWAQQYVGTIITHQGDTLEILPKIEMLDDEDNSVTKDVLFNMLQALNNQPFKQYDNVSLGAQKSSILEIFITLFLQELGALIQKGIKHDYIPIEGNFPFLKGKLDIAKQIQHNIIHKERFYVHFDERSPNIVENKIIKSSLLLLNKVSTDFRNKAHIAKYLEMFDNVQASNNLQNDFNQCHLNRINQHYQKVIEWCKLFLYQNSFNIYAGKHIAYALLFDMADLFEAYVTQYCKKEYKQWGVTAQASWHHLLIEPKKHVLKPDIIIGDKDNCIILDAKWKTYDDEKKIASSDLYQLYAYGKKYPTENVCLIYPKSADRKQKLYKYEEKLNLHILYFDCANNKLLDDDNIIDDLMEQSATVSYAV